VLALVAAGSLAGAIAGVAPALAAGHAHANAAANGRMNFFAGWVFSQKGATSVTSEYVVPAPHCTSTSTGASAGSFLYTKVSGKSSLNAANVILYCFSGRPVLAAGVQFGDQVTFDSHKPVPGDLMKTTVTTSSTATTASIQDLTAGHAFTLKKSTSGAPGLRAEIGTDTILKPGGASVYPVTDFGTIHFSAGKVKGKALGSTSGRGYDMVSGNQLLVQTGPLTGGGSAARHNAFTATRKHS
jgi:hypothetical protein